MTNCTPLIIDFPPCQKRRVQAQFTGGDVTSDGGVLLLRQVDKRLGLCKKRSHVIPDPRDSNKITHSQLTLLKQRIYGLALGYEDLNDHDTLRYDPAFQTAVECDDVLASDSTLCRLENRQARQVAWAMHKVLVELFIQSFDQPPTDLILDFDATDDRVHGQQQKRYYHGYYRNYCFLPLYVFCGDQLLVSYLRPSNQDAAKHSWAILALLVKRLRQTWPTVRIVFRGDGGFCRHALFAWCERQGVHYIVGIPRNKRLQAQGTCLQAQAAQQREVTGKAQRLFADFYYGANSGGCERRIIHKAEHTLLGANPRFIVTNLPGDPQWLYDSLYCARGEMENRIKEQQLALFADRTSCHAWWANQFRLLLSSAAYLLLDNLRRLGLKDTSLARAQSHTIRLRLLKIGAVIIRNTRGVRFLLSSAYPLQSLFFLLSDRLHWAPG